MEDFSGFVNAVLSHWIWLVAACIVYILSAAIDFADYRTRISLIVIAVGCVIVALYLAVDDQLTALHQYLGPR